MTIQSCSKTTAEAWAARQEMITETVAQFLYRAFPSDQARRRRSCKLVLRWLLDHRAETMDVELSAARIAAEITEQELEQRTGCSERTVQRVVSFLADVGVLRVWRRYNEDGGSLPPGGRLNWGAVLEWLGRESQGAALATCPERGRREAWSHSSAAVISARLAAPPSPVPAADFQAVSPRVEGTPVTPSTTPGVTRRNSCQPQGLTRESVSPGGGDTAGPCHPGAQAPVSPPPAAPPAAPPAGAGTRDAARILAAVRGWQAVCAEETALTDDAGQRRTVRWDQVRRAADEAAHVGRKGLDYAPLLAGRPLAALAWLSLAVFSPRWLTDSCSCAERQDSSGQARGARPAALPAGDRARQPGGHRAAAGVRERRSGALVPGEPDRGHRSVGRRAAGVRGRQPEPGQGSQRPAVREGAGEG